LKIYTEENINFSEAQKVMVNFKNVSKISASSGSDVYATNTLKVDNLKLETSSGSDMTLDLIAQSIKCDSASGSDLTLSGTTIDFTAEASSGSDINASKLLAANSQVQATSGADISTNTSEKLQAKASSGGNVKYSGNPSNVEKSDNVSGTGSQQ